MSNPTAPVCNIQGEVQPPTPSLSALQPIPKAKDLQTALKAIQALTNNFNYVLRNPARANFVEVKKFRTYVTNRIFDPNDSTVFVDVQQITHLVFVDEATGQTITWQQ